MEKFIPVFEPALNGNEARYLMECVQTGWISSLGKFITQFETSFASFCGSKHGVAVSNGTTALHLALVALGIGTGDEVIVPTLSFIATANAVQYTGAKVVFADSEAETWNIDPDKIRAKITPRTKAILPVHLYGHPANMQPILDLGEEYGIPVIEDAAEAHGALYQNKRVGSLGKMGVFSFYGNKIITTGEGGMILTDDDALAERLRFLRDHAMAPQKRYWHTEVGFNYRMTNLQAAVGLAQMEQIETFIARKRAIAQKYMQGLAGLDAVQMPPSAAWATSVYWMFTILLTDRARISRDELMAALKTRNIDSRPVFFPIHEMPPYYTEGEHYPVAEDLSRRGINLPSGTLLTDEDILRVCTALRELL